MPSEISIPFRVSGDGRLTTTDDPDAQVRLHVLALVNTTPQERVTVPGYGVDLRSLVFEPMTGDEVAASASVAVQGALAAWEPGVHLDSIEVNDAGTFDEQATLDVMYSRKDAGDSTATAVNANIAIIGSDGSVREIVRG